MPSCQRTSDLATMIAMPLEFTLRGGGGGGDQRAANVSVELDQPLIRDNPEEATGRDLIHCGSCGKYLKRLRKHSLVREVLEFFENESCSSRRNPLNTFDYVCHICFRRYERKRSVVTQQHAAEPEPQPVGQIELDIGKATCSQSKCVFGCARGRYRVSDSTRAQVARGFWFYIPPGSRVCDRHNKHRWTEVPGVTSNTFTVQQVTEMIDLLRNQITQPPVKFDYFEDLSNNDVAHWTGLQKETFLLLLNNLTSLKKTEQRHPECALAIYLAKLKTGLADQELADIFVNGKRSTAERLMNSARSAIETT